MKQIIKALVIAVTLLVMILPVTVSADGPDFGIKPEQPGVGYYRFTVEPGKSVKDVLLATNPGTESVFVRVMPVAVGTAVGGGLSYDYTKTSDALSWIDMPAAGVIKIKAESFNKLPFKVTVPEGTPPGEYAAGFLAQLEEQPGDTQELNENSVNIKVVTQVGIAVVIRVPGETSCNVAVTDFKSSPSNTGWHFDVNMMNSGKEPFKGTGEFLIKQGDKIIGTRVIDQGYSVAGEPFRFTADLEPAPAGEYTAELKITNQKEVDCSIDYSTKVDVSSTQSKQMSALVTAVAKNQVKVIPTAMASNSDGNNNENSQKVSQNTPNGTNTLFFVSLGVFALSAIMVGYVTLMLKRRK